MITAQEITRVWFNEGAGMGIECPEKRGRYLWNWPVEVSVADTVDYGQANVIWEGGLEFKIRRELSVDSKVLVRRQSSVAEPWVEVCIRNSTRDDDGAFVVEGSFDA